MTENGSNSTKETFASHWLTIQPHLFPEWEREMDHLEAEEELRRQVEAKTARKMKRISKASLQTAPPQ